MFVTFRTALLVAATLTASSVAPAQVGTPREPLIVEGSNELPVAAPVQMISGDAVVQPAVQTTAPSLSDDKDDEAAPAISRGASLADKVASLRSSIPGSREIECLAGAIYFESKSEGLPGQLAVGNVIANRVSSGRFASSYCGVVFQRSQFSFVRGHALPFIPRGGMQWKTAVAIAKIVDGKLHPSPMPKALFFHATHVSPSWRMTRLGTLGHHVFYR